MNIRDSFSSNNGYQLVIDYLRDNNIPISSLENTDFASNLLGYLVREKGVSPEDYFRALNDFYTNTRSSIYDGLKNGSMSGNDALTLASQYGLTGADASLADSINNQIAQDNAKTEYDREIAARDSSLESTFNQAQALGMNPTGTTLSLGGASAGVSTGAAANPGISAPALGQQKRLNEYNEKQKMTRQLISMAGSLAAAGIGGASYGLARGAAVRAARATVGSAKDALVGFSRPAYKDPKVSKRAWDKLMAQL